MKKIKVSEAAGPVLDWMVAKAEGRLGKWLDLGQGTSAEDVVLIGRTLSVYQGGRPDYTYYAPSTDWSHGGPIIEEAQLCVGFQHQLSRMYVPTIDPNVLCWARTTPGGFLKYGPTPLIAGMRCYVASRLGDEVEVPAELG